MPQVLETLLQQLKAIKVAGNDATRTLDNLADSVDHLNTNYNNAVPSQHLYKVRKRQLETTATIIEGIEPYSGVSNSIKASIKTDAVMQRLELESIAMVNSLREIIRSLNRSVTSIRSMNYSASNPPLDIAYAAQRGAKHFGKGKSDSAYGAFDTETNTILLTENSIRSPKTTLPHEMFHYLETQLRPNNALFSGSDLRLGTSRNDSSLYKTGSYKDIVKVIEEIQSKVWKEAYDSLHNKGISEFESRVFADYKSKPNEIFARNAASYYTTGFTEDIELQKPIANAMERWKKEWPKFFSTLDSAGNVLEEMKLEVKKTFPTVMGGAVSTKDLPSIAKAYTTYGQHHELLYDLPSPGGEDPEELKRRLRALLQQGARGTGTPDIEKTINELINGRELTRQMRMGQGSYLTRDKDIVNEIDAIVNELREMKGNFAGAAAASGQVEQKTGEMAKRLSGENIPLSTLEDVVAAKARQERIAENEKKGLYTNPSRLPFYEKLSQEDKTRLSSKLDFGQDIDKQLDEYTKLNKESTIVLKKLKDGWVEVSNVVKETAEGIKGNIDKVSTAYVKLDEAGNLIFDRQDLEKYKNPYTRSIEEQAPGIAMRTAPEEMTKLNQILDKAAEPFNKVQEEILTTENHIKRLDDGWVQFARTVQTATGSNRAVAYLNEQGKAFDETGRKAQLATELQQRQMQELQKTSNFYGRGGIDEYFSRRGLPIGGKDTTTKLTYLPQKYGKDVLKVDVEKFDQNINATRKMSVYTNEFGDVVTAANRRVQTFTEAIIRNTQEVFRWSIGVGLLYGTMYRLNALFQQTIENEAKLADIAVTLGLAQRNVNDIFMDAAKVAKETGESIGDVLQTYSMAYTAVGGIKDPIERTAAANQLLSDATILNKLSSLDAAEAIDTLSGSLRQVYGEELGVALSTGEATDMLDKWVKLSTKANVDLGALATAFSVTAESALNSGMSIEELNAVIATLSEKIGGLGGKETGNAVRALIGGVYQDQASKALSSYGIAVADTEGKMRNFLDISRDIYELYKQGIISEDQLNKLGYTLGGGVRRGQQYVAFLTDYNRIMENVAVQSDSAGFAQLALGKKVETTKTAMTEMNNAFLTFTQILGTDGGVLDSTKALLGILEGLANGLTGITKQLGSFTVPATLLAVLAAYQGLGGIPAQRRIAGFGQPIGNALGGLIGGGMEVTGKGFYGLAQLGIPGTAGIARTLGKSNVEAMVINSIAPAIAKHSLGVMLGSLPALSRIGEGGKYSTAAAAIDIGGAVAGAIIGGLVAPGVGATIGGVIGGAIADTFVAKSLTRKAEFQQLFDFTDMNEPGIRDTTKTAEETLLDKQEELTTRMFEKMGFGQEWLGRIVAGQMKTGVQVLQGIGVNKGERYATTEDVISGYALLFAKDLYEEWKRLRESEIVPLPTTEYDFYKRQKAYSDLYQEGVTQSIGGYRRELQSDMLAGEIKPSEYKNQLSQLSTATPAILRAWTALNNEIAKQSGLLNTVGISLEDVISMYAKGTPEALQLFSTQITAIEDLENKLDELEGKADDVVITLPDGSEKLVKELREIYTRDMQALSDDLVRMMEATLMEIDQLDVASIQQKLLPVVDMEGQILNKMDLQKVMDEALRLQEIQLNAQVKLGAITEEEKQKLKDSAEPFMVWLGQMMGAWLAEGLISQEYFNEAFKSLMDQAALTAANTPWEFMDYPIEQIQQAANSPAYFDLLRKLLAGGYDVNQTYKGVIGTNSNDPILMKKDWRIVQYLLSRILDVNEKQLEGVYNLPSGASFYVPFDAYKMGYANQGGGASGPIVEDNTRSTDMNTQAINDLTTKIKDIIANTDDPEKAKELIQKAIIEAVAQFGTLPSDVLVEFSKLIEEKYGKQTAQEFLDESLPLRAIEDAVAKWKLDNKKDIDMDTLLGIMTQIEATLGALPDEFRQAIIDAYMGAEGGRPLATDLSKRPSPGEGIIPRRQPFTTAEEERKKMFDLVTKLNEQIDLARQGKGPYPPGYKDYTTGTGTTVGKPTEPTKPGEKEPTTEKVSVETSLSTIIGKMDTMIQHLATIAGKNQTVGPTGLPIIPGQGTQQNASMPMSTINVQIQPQPIKVNFNTTTNLVVDGLVLASVIMPYVYAALIRSQQVAGTAVRPHTYV